MKKNLRVLVFGSFGTNLGSTAIVKALSPFAIVEEISWLPKTIPDRRCYFFQKIFWRIIECFYWSLRLFKKISEFHANIIFVEYAYFPGLIGAIAGKISRKSCVIHAVGSDLKIDTQSLLGKSAVTWALRNVSGVICVSSDLENIAKGFGAKNTIIIPPPLDLSDFDEKDFCEKDWEIITVAMLFPIKGLSYLIRAMRHLKHNRLLIIGDGPERKKLESLSSSLELSDRVCFQGGVDHRLVWDYLQRAKVFVLPSISEGCPRVLVEAMAVGLPIVATRVGGIPEVITNGVNGLLVPPRNEKALAEAIREILLDETYWKEISSENKKIIKDYSMPVIGRRIYYYLKKIL